jgi:hypothetical protein
MLKIGDKVKFLNAVGGGTVTGFMGQKMVNVEDEQGFEIPCLITELVKDERFEDLKPSVNRASAKVIKAEVKKPVKEIRPLFASSAGKPASPHPAYFFAFVPEIPSMPLSGELVAWLVNDSRFTLLYHFSTMSEGTYQSEKSGRLAAYSRIPLKGFTQSDFAEFPEFGIQILPFESKGGELLKAIVKTIKINPVRFYKDSSFIKNPYFETRALVLDIKEKDLSKELDKLRQHDFSAPVAVKDVAGEVKNVTRKSDAAELKEVDLHVHELVENFEGLEPKELLDLQMDRFRYEMESAIQNGTRRIVFIHGVGQGTLKSELRRELASRYKKYDFQDASFREYGYGATMVILRRK